MCGHPENACPWFAEGATPHGWLVCPRGPNVCGSGASWGSREEDERLVESAITRASAQWPGEVSARSGRTLVGFSLGGIVALDLAQKSEGKYVGLVLIAAQARPNAALLKKAGVHRVVMAAGDYDMTHDTMESDARALDAAGLSARFVSLGKVGHTFPRDMSTRMKDALDWVAGA
jgi:predicted esterase